MRLRRFQAGPKSISWPRKATFVDPVASCGHDAEEILDEGHSVLVVRVRLVPLEHRELGLVLVGDALVAEVLADLVDLLEPADDEALEVELVRDAQVEVGVELVRVRDERLGERAAVARLQDRSLDLDEPARVEVAADGRHELAADEEVAPRLLVDEEIEVALAIAGLRVHDTVVGVGKRPPDLREELELGHRKRRLAALRLRGMAAHADDVPQVDVEAA